MEDLMLEYLERLRQMGFSMVVGARAKLQATVQSRDVDDVDCRCVQGARWCEKPGAVGQDPPC